MSGECEKCGNHATECECSRIVVDKHILMDLIHWARRYCDGSCTFSPHTFNAMYQVLKSQYPETFRCYDRFDNTLTNKGKYWPYAQDGQFKEGDDSYDARSKGYSND